MKKLMIVIIAVLGMSNVFSQGIEFEHGTFEEALARAKSENKIVFMDCYTTWCGPCKRLAKNVFPQKEVGDFFNANFINLKMDMEKGEGIELRKKFAIVGFPTLLWLDAEGNVLHQKVGGTDPQGLIETAKIANNPKLNWGSWVRKFKAGNRSLEFLQSYINEGLRSRVNIDDAVKAYYSVRKEEELFNKKDFRMLMLIFQSIDSDKFIFVLNNKAKFSEKIGAKEVDQYIGMVLNNAFVKAKYTKDAAKIEKITKRINELDPANAAPILELDRILPLQNNPDKNIYYSAYADYLMKYYYDNYLELNDNAWSIADSPEKPNQEVLKKAVKMAQRSVEIEAHYYNIDTYAFALFKLGNIEEATKQAQRALDLAPENDKKNIWAYEFLQKK